MTGGNGQMMAVLERAAREAHPGSRVYALDGDSSFLRDSFFDLAVIGAELPAEAMRGIARAVRNGGSVTSVYGGGFEERRVTEGIRTESPGLGDEMRGLRAKLARVMGESPEQLSAVIAVLTEMERLAIKLFDIADIDLKQRVIEAKENALNALYAPDGAYRADQLERLGEYITGKG
jgi:hypothetical protein